MARRKIVFAQDQYYHIYNRGCNREDIFRTPENYLYLLRLLGECRDNCPVAIIAYCLMPNHYHFLLRQESDTPLSILIQAIFNAYTKAFNKRYRRSGTLFEGPFEAIHVDKE
ncbi:MAG TPA: transposase, partial [Bacteroidota bacterium]|nr:transposase [Bacteroidota bacterium]